MTHYSSLRNLSVVEHNQMLSIRANAKTEASRLNALDLLLVEMEARRNCLLGVRLSDKALRIAHAKATKALQAFFKAKDRDNTFEPMFKVI